MISKIDSIIWSDRGWDANNEDFLHNKFETHAALAVKRMKKITEFIVASREALGRDGNVVFWEM